MSDGGKGSARRPGVMPPGAWEAIEWSKKPAAPPPFCELHKMALSKCGCVPTDDGPGQDGSEEVKAEYERRRFNREGV
jgi:hypothetical protein